MTTISTSIRLDASAKEAAYQVFDQLGIKPAQAINLFLKQVAWQKGIPFELKIPNAETIAAIEETYTDTDAKGYDSFAQLREELDL